MSMKNPIREKLDRGGLLLCMMLRQSDMAAAEIAAQYGIDMLCIDNEHYPFNPQRVEALARAGVGALDLYDDDTVSESNLNRQLAALRSTIGQPKAEVAARRVADINPDCAVRAIRMFYLPQNADTVDLGQYDYVVDCIDTVAAKLDIAQRCARLNVPLISAMGTGNKLDPTGFVVTDISKTQGCPLARVMRKELRKRGIRHLKVVYSQEQALTPLDDMAISCRSHCICPPSRQRPPPDRTPAPAPPPAGPPPAPSPLSPPPPD